MLQPHQPPNAADPSPIGPPLDPIAPLRAALRGHYDIEREIGQGAFATVYLARDLKHERKVALKVLNADPTSEIGELRFIREIRTLARLQHPNILPLHDSGHVGALLYYVMPYVNGETLRDRIDRERQVPVDTACTIAREVADALAYAHAQGIIHRDIKPENILLSARHPIIADFGIARVLDLAGVRQLTRTGTQSPGTPAYMSPEQLLGDREIDGRTDTYSLGCVLFEMLTGKPPFNGKEGFVKRFTEPPPRPSAIRRNLPVWIDAVIERALARNPNERYPTAQQFVAALWGPMASADSVDVPLENRTVARNRESSVDTSPHPRAPDVTPSLQVDRPELREFGDDVQPSRAKRLIEQARIHGRLSAAIAIALVALVSWFATGARTGGVTKLFSREAEFDSSRFVVLPFSTSALTDTSHIGNRVADRLYDGFSQWEGLTVVPDTKVAQGVVEAGAPPSTEREALALARRLGAGKLVWGQALDNVQGTRVRVHLYDVATGESRDSFVLMDSASDASAYGPAILRLLGARNRVAAAIGGDGRTRSLAAWQAYGRGHTELRRWNLLMAEREFRTAMNADHNYQPARLWLAQVMSWRSSQRGGEWVDEAARAAVDVTRLDPRDQLLAAGLSALADGRFPAACAVYSKLIRSDSSSFLGWYGLGECQLQDSLVVRNARSPSGWAFRSSYYSAARAFLRALKEDPGAHAIFSAGKLQRLLPIAATKARRGVAQTDRSLGFAAFPTLEADTVGFVPYPLARFGELQRGPSTEAALRKDAQILIAFATNWAKRFPSSAAAQEALAEAFETRGDLDDGSRRKSPALRAVDSALALSNDKRDLLRLKTRQVRLHFKRGEFATARYLTDSILEFAGDEAGASDQLEWIAALTGRANLMAKYRLSSIGSEKVTGGAVAPVVARNASRFFAYAALGVCGAPLTAAREELDVAIRRYVDNDIRHGVEADMAARASSLATPCTNGSSALRIGTPTDLLQKAQQAFARGDLRTTTAFLDAAARARRNNRPGDLSPDYIFQDAWLRTQVGDTADAVAALDAELETLPAFSAPMFDDAASAASFGRAMALRSDLAVKRGEWDKAARWSRAIDSLWAGADRPLRAVVEQVKVRARVGPAQ
ncbi:MAG: serine/threonine protein kinase [Gemmatimonadota bacterium]|nr:serine/threonine protein kinase [Gemmatimonadota bacterium]